MLRQLTSQSEEMSRGEDNPTIECEICGKKAKSHTMLDIYIQVLSPFDKEPVFCLQHWACSIPCFVKAHEECLNTHILPKLIAMQGGTNG